MAWTMTDALKNAILDSGFDAVFNSGTLEIRSGSKPTTANLAVTGTLLASITLPADAFSAAAAGSKAKAGTWQDTSADAAGTAGWCRFKATGDTNAVTQAESRLDGTVTATGGGGDITLDNAVLALAQSVTINTFTVSIS